MTYVAAPDRYDDKMPTADAAAAGSSCRRSRSGSGRTSATTAPLDTQRAILRRAFDLGVTHFDLANNYGPPLRLGRGELRRDHALRTCARIATSWSSPPRPATTCGPGRTATGARASTCWPASTRVAGAGWAWTTSTSSTRHRFDPETPLEETMGALDTAVRSGQGAVRRHLVVLGRADRARRPRSCASWARRC